MDYDVITVGGGLAGAALAGALAEKGLRVMVFERETTFKDRVRGEQMECWGVDEARKLGIYEKLRDTCGHELRFWSTQLAGAPLSRPRDLVETTPGGTPAMDYYHPEMQATLLEAAEHAGADVRRGAAIRGIEPGRPAGVLVEIGDESQRHSARLVVGADGRTEGSRRWGGFEAKQDPKRLVIAGTLYHGLRAPEDRVSLFMNPARACGALTAPLGKQRFRTYAIYHKRGEPYSFTGADSVTGFVACSVAAGTPREWFEGAQIAGPLAAFEGAETWVDHPYRNGVALIGDAAASTDPSFGSGLSLTLRDARVLRDHLLGSDDWEAAGHAYAADHDRYHGDLHRLIDWLTDLLYEPGPTADAIRARALPRIAADPTRIPDIVGKGPDSPSDENARRRLFGDD